jgi:hypothetical protein
MRRHLNSVKFPFVGMDSPHCWAKPLRQVDCAVPGLTSVYGRSRPSAGHPPIALSLQGGSTQAAPLSRTGPSPRSRHRLQQAKLTWIFSETWISFRNDSILFSFWLAARGRTDREANPRSALGQFDRVSQLS